MILLRMYSCYKVDFLCHNTRCRYYIDSFDIGNCVLRCDKEYSQREIGDMLGITYQQVQHIENSAKEKLKRHHKLSILWKEKSDECAEPDYGILWGNVDQ